MHLIIIMAISHNPLLLQFSILLVKCTLVTLPSGKPSRLWSRGQGWSALPMAHLRFSRPRTSSKSPGLRGLALHQFCDGLWCWASAAVRCWMSCAAFVGLVCTTGGDVNSGHSMKQLKAVASSRIYCKIAKDSVFIKQSWGAVWKRQHLLLFLSCIQHEAEPHKSLQQDV